MPRRLPPDDYVKGDRWVISYADFITLLFAFFVVMYAYSSLNEEKYRDLSEALNSAFIGLGGGNQPEARPGHRALQSLPDEGGSAASLQPPGDVPGRRESAELRRLRTQLESALPHLLDAGDVRLEGNELWLAIELRSSFLFASGDALPTIAADQLMEQIARLLKGRETPIHVEGFTDDRAISTDQYPSNWELSAARAAAIVRLLALNGVEPGRMAAVGYGEYQPAYSNRTASGRSLNRRVVIVVSRDEKVRRALSAFGSQQVSEDAVSGVIRQAARQTERGTVEQTRTAAGGMLFRQMVSREESNEQE